MKHFSELIADTMNIPKDVAMDLPRISVCGDKEIYVENHKGLVEYGENDIRIKMKDGIIHICGKGLRIIVMKYNVMVINGDIVGINFEKIGEKNKKC